MPNSKKLRIREVRLTNTLANHNKFYELVVMKDGPDTYHLYKRWGRIGAPSGQTEEETYASNAQAQAMLDKVKRSKMAKGYIVEFDRSGVPVQNPAVSLKSKFKKLKAEKDELPKGSTFDLSGDEEAKTWSDVVAKRKGEAEW